jgi:general secretion pathway protein E
MASEEERRYFSVPVSRTSSFTLHRGRGCDRCRGSGYLGRTGIFEVLPMTNEIRQMIAAKKDSQVIKDQGVSAGMRTLYADGLNKAVKGDTTLQEVLRVTQKDYIEG